MNKATSKPKGTAFVEYDAPESAIKAVAASKAYADGAGPGVSLRDKQLVIDAALVQDSARSLAATGNAKGGASDKRNLYLVRLLQPFTAVFYCNVFVALFFLYWASLWVLRCCRSCRPGC
jgi:RNA recognition motif-containing protein